MKKSAKWVCYLSIVLLGAFCDQCIKYRVRMVPVGQVLGVFPPLFRIIHVENTGVSFSLLADHPFLIQMISLSTIPLLFFLLIYLGRYSFRMGLRGAVLAAGGVGNLLDRFCYGSVTDYLDFLPFRLAVFNLADVFVVIGAFLLILSVLKKR